MAEEKPTRVSCCADCTVTLEPGDRTLTIRIERAGATKPEACSCIVVCGQQATCCAAPAEEKQSDKPSA